MENHWIPIARIATIVDTENILVLYFFISMAWLIYKVLLRNLNAERHRNMQGHFQNMLKHAGISFFLAFVYWTTSPHMNESIVLQRLAAYFGLFAFVWMGVCMVKLARIFTFEYLFFNSMKEGVPLLLINLLSLLISAFLIAWAMNSVFGIQLTPFLATSAVFSLVLGLAMQETLGNLFAGISLQFDKPYAIGDWVEIQNGSTKIVGQVSEISWRATLLTSFTDEAITVPNRVMAQSHLWNFSLEHKPIIRSLLFRVPLESDVAQLKELLLTAVESIHSVLKSPNPLVYVNETTDSWIALKLIYYIQDYGQQYGVADEIYMRALKILEKNGVSLAANRLQLLGEYPELHGKLSPDRLPRQSTIE